MLRAGAIADTSSTGNLLQQLNIKGEEKVEATAAFTILALLATTAALAGFFKPILFTIGHGIGALCGLIAMCVWGRRLREGGRVTSRQAQCIPLA